MTSWPGLLTLAALLPSALLATNHAAASQDGTLAIPFHISALEAEESFVSHHSDEHTHIDESVWTRNALHLSSSEKSLPLTLALKQRNLDKLEELFFAVSDPKHKQYGQHLSIEDITDLVSATDETISTVWNFVKAHGATDREIVGNGDYMRIKMPLGSAERLLNTTFSSYRHKTLPLDYIRADKPYSLPLSLAAHVDYISGVHKVPSERALRSHYRLRSINSSIEYANTSFPSGLEGISLASKVHLKETSAHLMVPLAWRGSNVALLSTIRCRDGKVLTKGTICRAPAIDKLTAGVYPLANLPDSTIEVEWPKALGKECRVCSDFKDVGIYRGRKVSDVCSLMLDRAKLPKDSIVCYLTIPDVEIGSNSMVDVTVVYEDGSHSDEAHCAETVSYHNCTRFITPQPDVGPEILQGLYRVPAGTKVHDKRSTQGVAEFLGEYFSDEDLQIYFDEFKIAPQKVEKVWGPNDESKPGGEASLDIQVMMGLSPGSPTQFYSMGGLRDLSRGEDEDNQEPFLEFLVDFNVLKDAPLVMSFSYGDDEEAQPKAYTDRVHGEFMKAGLRGLTFLFAAGDDGVGGDRVRKGGVEACPRFYPEWPSSSPYVTSVGGTVTSRYLDEGEGQLREAVSDVRAGSIITTGGGFSNRYPIPDYQKTVVQRYLQLARRQLPPQNFFNHTGRAYPDVSAMATNYMVKLGELGFISVGGTSASTPAVASLITLLNDLRLRSGQPPIGFANPLLYDLDDTSVDAFFDVTRGNNKCSENADKCCPYGFEAVSGFDAATGIGTPNFRVLASLIVKQFKTEASAVEKSGGKGGDPTVAPLDKRLVSPIKMTMLLVVAGVLLSVAVWKYRQSHNAVSPRRRDYDIIS